MSDQVVITVKQAWTLLFNVGGLMVLAFLIGFIIGENSERKFRDKLDKVRGAS